MRDRSLKRGGARDRFVGAADPERAEALLDELIRHLARELAAEDHRAEQERASEGE